MQYREDKRSGNNLSILGFGCMRFSGSRGRIDKAKAEELLIEAFESGVNYYDTAYLYSGSEELVGEIFEKHGLREKVFIATKLPIAFCRKTSDFDRYFETQKQRLRTDYIDYYLLHNVTDFAQWERLCGLGIEEWIAAKKASGEVREIGFSFHGAYSEFVKLIDAYTWDFVQIQYNYMNTHYQAGTEGLHYAAEKGLPVIIMEPLLGGKLAELPQEANALLQAAKPGSTPVEWALRFIWDDPAVTLLLSGMNEMSQLEENLRLAGASLPDSLTKAEHQVIEGVKTEFGRKYKIACTGCNYCMPCPQKINIPSCFTAYNASFVYGRMEGIKHYVMTTGAAGGSPHFVSDCIECGACEAKCPQSIKIREELKSVRRRLQLPGMRLLSTLFGKRRAKKE